MALVKWFLYGMAHDPAKRIGVCARCSTPYEGTADEWGFCQVCGTIWVHVPA
jgi:rRNA maturation endonuclease Nob1